MTRVLVLPYFRECTLGASVQPKRVIQLSIVKKNGFGLNLTAVGFKFQLLVKTNPERPPLPYTYRVRRLRPPLTDSPAGSHLKREGTWRPEKRSRRFGFNSVKAKSFG